ncbi:MAG TPA: hypothetical protein VHX52_07880 [Steroidobacteraceae bacterium]|jgi:hypothetical protein|nr:hypothetical protein [Steroidobacteraceae bacterium]
MKLALVVHAPVPERSFTIDGGRAYTYQGAGRGSTYPSAKSIENRLFSNIWNIPFLYDGSFFFNYSEGLPQRPDVDVVLAAYEVEHNRHFLKNQIHRLTKSPSQFMGDLRRAFPNAAIIAYAKEMHPQLSPLHRLTRTWFASCDAVALPYIESVRSWFASMIDRPVHFLPYPYAIDALQAAVPPAEKANVLMHVTRRHAGRAADTAFARSQAERHGLELIEGVGLEWFKWLSTIRGARICLNLDPTPRVGQVPIECAILGTQHLGGQADAAVALFPDTATIDRGRLEALLDQMIEQPAYDPRPAEQRVRERHSFEAARRALGAICSQLRGERGLDPVAVAGRR